MVEELYRLKKDPTEMHPAFLSDPTNAAMAKELRAIMDGLFDEPLTAKPLTPDSTAEDEQTEEE